MRYIPLFLALLAASGVARADHSKCNRDLRYANLEGFKAGLTQKLEKGQTVAVATKSDSAFNVGYVFRIVNKDPELIMAVFSSYAEQSSHIKELKESTVVEQKGNYARVRYELDTGHWYVPNSHYEVNDRMGREGDTFMLNWDLASGSGVSKPSYIDGYLRTEPAGKGALIIYCNYSIPNIDLDSDTVNKEGLEMMEHIVSQTGVWVHDVVAGRTSKNEQDYRSQLRAMLENR